MRRDTRHRIRPTQHLKDGGTPDGLVRELTRLYRDLDEEIARRGWRCRACGRCCHFAKHGHELFCSRIEAEHLVAGARIPRETRDEVCIFLDDTRCTRHERRTLGCRTYFCDADAQEMGGLAESYLGRLKALHDRLASPWRYDRLSAHLARHNALLRKE